MDGCSGKSSRRAPCPARCATADAARGRGTRAQFLKQAARHRFCLIAQGDPGNTAKIVETLILGGAGGCLPVFVLSTVRSARGFESEVRPSSFARDYPYTRWLDYCTIGFFVTQHAAMANASRLLEWLAAVTPEGGPTNLVPDAFSFRLYGLVRLGSRCSVLARLQLHP